jgi:hypothetical protein
MRMNYLTTGTLAALAGLAMQTTILAADPESGGVKFMFPVGLTYVNGAFDLNDALEDSLEANGYTVTDNFVWPVGLSFNPRVEFPFGLGVGLALGPAEFLVVDKDNNGDDDDFDNDDVNVSFSVPVGGYLQYNFLRDKTVSPYARVGVRYPITGGDYIKSGSVGAFVAVGVEFYRTKKVGFGAEVGYDWSEVEVSAGPVGGEHTVKPIGFNVSIFALF